mgnify:CR=1 FL=1
MSSKTIYAMLGEENLRTMVNRFYDLVQKNEIISPLFKGEFEEIRQKQFMFLTQFFGGPGLYTKEFGHPKMRMRHLPHAITAEAKDEWLKCMKASVYSLDIEDNLKDAVYNSFPAIAQHMVNR